MRGIGQAEPVCPNCRAPRHPAGGPADAPGAAGAGAARAAARGRHGWRLTLPNHAVVRLNPGLVRVGRASEGTIGDVLQYFPHVHREHLSLNVHNTTLELKVPKKVTNPVFLYSPESPEPGRLEPGGSVALDDTVSNTCIVCLGQCCFIKIDRGEA
jgi:hypothetical protein